MKKIILPIAVCLIALVTASALYGAALTAERNTPQKAGRSLVLNVAASTKIFAGAMVSVDATGNATNANGTVRIQVVGRAEETVDNLTGTNGAKTIKVATGIFGWGYDTLDDGDIGTVAYVVDNQSVSKTNIGQTNIAGVIFDVDERKSLVFVDTGKVNP